MDKKMQKMPEEELKEEIRDFLTKRKILVLCTCANNVPRATPMDFYIDKKPPSSSQQISGSFW